MKKTMMALAVMTALVFGPAGPVQAIPTYYTFEGDIYYHRDDAGILADAGLSLGDTVTYTFLMDFDADGYETYNNGDVYTYMDSLDWDYFYVDYISGDAIFQKDGGFYNAPTSAAEKNWGYDSVNPSSIGGAIHANSEDDMIQLKSTVAMPSDWQIGTQVTAMNWAFDPNNRQSQIFANVTLVDIYTVYDVPEPSSLLLLGTGMVGLIGLRRKFSN